MTPTIPHRLEFVRVTEVGKFKDCRRAWYLSEIRGLVPKLPQDYLWFGDKMHIGLEILASPDGDIDKAITAYMEACNASLPQLEKGYGGLWGEMQPMYQELVSMGRAMLHNYVLFDRATNMKLKTASVEERFFVPIRTASGRSALKGSPQLSGRFDRLAVVEGQDGEYIQDRKNTASVWQQGRGLELDDQTTGYHYIYWRVRGYLPRGMIYDTLLKKIPNEPKVLKSGKLSKDRDQGTTYELYMAALKERGESPAEYAEILGELREQGWSKYFAREVTTRNLQQVKNYEEHLYFTFQDMREVARDPRKAYPSPSAMRCPRCPFLNVCLAMEDGSDAEDIINSRFTVSEEKRW